MEDYKNLLTSGLQQLCITLPDSAIQKLYTYVELLLKWNKVYNLTAVRDPAQMITHHILDSLAVLPHLKDVSSILDVGTGAGLPGIPLAIARPDISFKLLDSQQKKITFVQHVITSLQLTNVSAVWSRIELLQDVSVDMIISRAFSSLEDYVNLIAKICDAKTKIVAMKGRQDLVLEEQQQLPKGFTLTHIQEIFVPELNAERCLVFLQKQGD